MEIVCGEREGGSFQSNEMSNCKDKDAVPIQWDERLQGSRMRVENAQATQGGRANFKPITKKKHCILICIHAFVMHKIA